LLKNTAIFGYSSSFLVDGCGADFVAGGN